LHRHAKKQQVKLTESNVQDVYAEIRGPENTPFENGVFKMKLVLPADYPTSAPKGYFLTKIFHPNIRQPSGEICVNTLKRDWKPDLGLRHVLMVIRCLMIEPFPESALNEEAARMLLEEYDEYFARAKMFTKVHAAKVEEGSGAATATATTAKKKGNVLDAKDGNSLSESGKENGSSGKEGKEASAGGENANVVKKAKKVDKKKSLRRL
tara:strand:+ start:114 stop:740 length:627 start_codon:yes stop_codon:yes gene_type:complete